MDLFDYYNDYNEQDRLERDKAHALERVTTRNYLIKHLPAGVSVLDCCAGTGEYAFWLADKGYGVTAGDAVPKHADVISASPKAAALRDIYTGDIRDMSRFGDGAFDAVLCMGALYHLPDETDRRQAVAECLRALKGGGVLALAYINRAAVFAAHFKRNPSAVGNYLDIQRNGLSDEVFYGADFGEIGRLAAGFGLETLDHIGVDGLAYILSDEINSLNDEQFEQYLEHHFMTCGEPSVLGQSMHGLYIGKKPSGKGKRDE